MKKKHYLYMFFMVGVGGAVGTYFRFFVNLTLFPTVSFPIETLIVNILGSFILGCLVGWLVYGKMNEYVKNAIGVGFCGGFTTMSTFAADVYRLYAGKLNEELAIYLSVSLFGGILLAFLGILLFRKLGLRKQMTKAGEAN